ncbi:MAG: hypothetical protein GQ529_06275, partial [Methyloprofundus sp.]|nr:hypothetical protein [Methyloprofundus sp.]
MNDKGVLFQRIYFFVEEYFTALKLNISARDYFKKTLNGKTWYTDSSADKSSEKDSGRIYLQRIRNYSDGVKSTQFIMPISVNEYNIDLPKQSYNNYYQLEKDKTETKRPIALASTSYFQSLVAPVLPYGFDYAIIDDLTGIVLYHSQEERVFSENFYSETEYNNQLIAAIKSGKEHRIDCDTKKNKKSCGDEIHYSISGKYHSEQTNFHVIPLKIVPWTLVTFYPKEFAHSIAIESGVTSFIAFLLYTTIFYILILISSLCSRALNKTDNNTFSCAWFWPQKSKKERYLYVCIILIPFCIIYALGVYYFTGWHLITYLLFVMVAQLLLIYLSLKDLRKSNKKKPKDNTINKEFKSVYVLMVTMVLFLFSVIPSIALYKDSLSFYSEMYARQGQIDVAQQVQVRYSKLDTFAKLFFPSTHGQSNGFTKCSHFDFSDPETGLFGFTKDLNLDIKTNIVLDEFSGCSQINTADAEVQDDPISKFRLSRYLFKHFAGFYLYLSQQYTTSLNNFAENNWHFKGNTLSFSTVRIHGKQQHEITSEPLTFSRIFATLLPNGLLHSKASYNVNESLSGFAIFSFILAFCLLFPFWFYRRISFIVKQIFAVDLSIDKENKDFDVIIDEYFPLTEQCCILINGDDRKIKSFCCEKSGIKNTDLTDINLTKIEGKLENFVKVFTSDSAQGKSNINVYIFPDFMYTTSDKQIRIEIRIYLEKLLDETSNDKNTFVLICAEVHPLHCMDSPELFTGTHMESFSSASYHKEKHLWVKILCNFVELNGAKPSEDEKYPQYRKLWSVCNLDERLMLYQLATDRFVNPKNRKAILNLYSRGYIVRDPYFKIPNEKFKAFIKSAESISTFHQWEKDAAHSIWANIKAPLFVGLVFLAGLFIYISTDALETTIGLMTP